MYEGAEVSIHYDPMISKFAVLGRDRPEAIDRMRRALAEYEVAGIKTTLPFFREVMEDEEFQSGKLDTGFISRFSERRKETLPDQENSDLALIAAALASSKQREQPVAATTNSGPSRWAMSGRVAIHDR